MNPGSILFDEQYRFTENKSGKKLLITLNDGDYYPYIVVKVTSKRHNRGVEYGCQPKDRFPNFFLPQGCCFFEKNTWAQLEDFREFDSDVLIERHIKGEIRKVDELPKDITIELIQCALESVDITFKQAEILQRTLAALRNS